MPQTIFLSWSGKQSKHYAEAWRRWIRKVFPKSEVFLSSKDIRAGADWRRVLSKNIRSTKIGIVYITAQNRNQPWILFEAGALAIAKRRRLIICVISGSTKNLPDPLKGHNAQRLDRDGSKMVFDELRAVVGKPKMKFSAAWLTLKELLKN